MTSGGAVNATSSGIASGTATASFVSSVLVVNAAANTPANIRCASILLGNNISGSNYMTLSPAGSLAASFTLTYPPALPSVNSYIQSDNAGNLSFVSAAASGSNNASSSNISVSSGSNLTLATVSITSNGNVVRIELQSNPSAGGSFIEGQSGTWTLNFFRGATQIGSYLVPSGTFPPGSFNFTDLTPGTGSVSYSMQGVVGSGRIDVSNVIMAVIQ